MKILITGGLGFIGSNLVRTLVAKGQYDIKIIDSLIGKVHETERNIADEMRMLGAKVRIMDIRALSDEPDFISDRDVIVHLAAETGTAQSMYQVDQYVDVNCRGTAVLLDMIMNKVLNPKKIILASSRSIYGEGAKICSEHGIVYPVSRSSNDLHDKFWSLRCPICKTQTQSAATPEDAPVVCASIYAHSKYSQEELLRIGCLAKNIDFVALRFQNVYGAGQSLKNPYTGILSIFSNRIKQNMTLPLFEDGEMGRDFVYVSDVVESICLAIESQRLAHQVYNIGSGELVSIREVTEKLLACFKSSSEVIITGEYRIGDIRACFADIRRAQSDLGFTPVITLEDGLHRFAEWVKTQPLYDDGLAAANRELHSRDLMK